MRFRVTLVPPMSTTAHPQPPQPSTGDPEFIAAMDDLIRRTGHDPDESYTAMRAREIIHTALKLLGDGADLGEMKLLSRSLKELRYALKVFKPYADCRKISVFGSARVTEEHPTYQAAVEFSRQMAESGWMVITGAGDGIMRAGHGGAGREKSFGVSIRLPFETNANDYIIGDPKLINFRYFFTRKLMFMWQAHAVALFAGGFGTQDEGFEALTLIQTGKAPLVPIVMVDAEGDDYWHRWDHYVRTQLLDESLISPADLNLYFVTRDVDEAAAHVLNFYRNFHSQRFVRDTLVLRMHRPLKAEQVEALNEEFALLIKEGRVEQGGPLSAERESLHLPRLKFHFAKRGYGRLRAMIDRINAFDRENTPAGERQNPAPPPHTPDLTQAAEVI